MSRYYFLLTSLPEIEVGKKPEVSFKEVKQLIELNVSSKDLKAVQKLLLPVDLYNIKALWLGFPLDEKGNFSKSELEEALLARQELPSYIIDFIERYDSTEDRLRNFSSLYASLYRDLSEGSSGFLKKYFSFEREVRLILTALRAKAKASDFLKEFQFEDPIDPLIQQILSQKDAPEYTPPSNYEVLKAIFIRNRENPKELNKELLQYHFKKIEEMEENEFFSIDRLLGYLARLMIVEDLANQDFAKGQIKVDEISQYG